MMVQKTNKENFGEPELSLFKKDGDGSEDADKGIVGKSWLFKTNDDGSERRLKKIRKDTTFQLER